MNVQPLRDVFESLSDPLAEHRRNQPLGRTLTMVFLAIVSGENSERGVTAWIEEQRWRLKGIFGFRRDAVPSYSTIQRARGGCPRVWRQTEGLGQSVTASDEWHSLGR